MVEAKDANRLIAALPPDIVERWLPHLDPAQMHIGKSVYEAGQTLSHVYFATTAL